MGLISSANTYLYKQSGWLSGESARLSYGRSWGRAPPKTIIKMVQTASMLDTQALGLVFGSAARLCKRPSSVCGTVYGDMYHKNLLESVARVGYCISDVCLRGFLTMII